MSKKTTTVISAISTIFAIAGIVCFFCGLRGITIICAAATIIDSFVQIRWGDQNNFLTEIFALVVGLFVALITHASIVHVMAVALCIWSVAATILGWIPIVLMMRRFK